MNIKPTDLISGMTAYKNQALPGKKTDAQAKRNMQPDEFILSNQSVERHSIQQAYEVSDVRHDLVAALRERIQSGAYQVNSYDLAAKIIETHKGNL